MDQRLARYQAFLAHRSLRRDAFNALARAEAARPFYQSRSAANFKTSASRARLASLSHARAAATFVSFRIVLIRRALVARLRHAFTLALARLSARRSVRVKTFGATGSAASFGPRYVTSSMRQDLELGSLRPYPDSARFFSATTQRFLLCAMSRVSATFAPHSNIVDIATSIYLGANHSRIYRVGIELDRNYPARLG